MCTYIVLLENAREKASPSCDRNIVASNMPNKYQIMSGLAIITDYGRPMKPFFHRNPKLLGLSRQFEQINFGYFRPIYQHPFWCRESLVHVFH